MSCSTGFISIIDPFLNPDSTEWTGSITYTLLYATTVAGATLIQARQNLNVVDGIDLCMAPGLYNVTYNQSGQDYPVSAQWNVPSSGGPYTIADISAGTFPPPEAAGATGEVQFNAADVFAADSTFTFDSSTKNLTLSGGAFSGTSRRHLIGETLTALSQSADLLYVGANTSDGNAGIGIRAVKGVAQISGNPTVSSTTIIGGWFAAGTTSGVTAPMTANAVTGSLTGLRGLVTHNGSGQMTLASGVASQITGTGPLTTAIIFNAPGQTATAAVLFTTRIGLQVGTSTTGTITDHFGVKVDALGVGTNRWAFYASADIAYFGGLIQLPLTTPASSAAVGAAGTIAVDANFIYVWTATNTVKRAALTAF